MLVGADPEVFAKRGGVYVSAHNLIPGTKDRPHPVPSGAVQVDGMALEFNIDPADSEDEFVYNIQEVLAHLRGMVPDYEVVADPVARFTKEYMDAQPEESLELGCNDDWNAWSGEVNEVPDQENSFRTGAGHVHLGWTEGADGEAHLGMCTEFVKQSDFYLGLPSVLYDDDTARREMYGKAGAFRPKSYGVEYRVLSNKWLVNEQLTRWVFKASQNCFDSMRGEKLYEKYGDIQEVINTSNKTRALEIIRAENLLLPEVA